MNIKLKVFILLSLSMIFMSCDDSEPKVPEGGIVPFAFKIEVVDGSGNNYVADGTLLEKYPNPKVLFNGKEYAVVLLEHFINGAKRDRYNFIIEKEKLTFGLFIDERDSKFEIVWSEGDRDVVAFKTDEGNRLTSMSLNGKSLELGNYPNRIRIVK